MTNDAPERIWAWPKGSWFTAGASDKKVVSAGAMDVEYIRADSLIDAQAELQAAVAAEREACAAIVDEYKRRADGRVEVSRGVGKNDAADRHEGQSGAAVSIAAAIRVRTDPDAQAVLEAVKREARNEGRMEAADAARSWYHNLGKGTPHDAILALMEVTDDDDK